MLIVAGDRDGWIGETCSIPCPRYQGKTCGGNGVCMAEGFEGVCKCKLNPDRLIAFHSGEACQTPVSALSALVVWLCWFRLWYICVVVVVFVSCMVYLCGCACTHGLIDISRPEIMSRPVRFSATTHAGGMQEYNKALLVEPDDVASRRKVIFSGHFLPSESTKLIKSRFGLPLLTASNRTMHRRWGAVASLPQSAPSDLHLRGGGGELRYKEVSDQAGGSSGRKGKMAQGSSQTQDATEAPSLERGPRRLPPSSPCRLPPTLPGLDLVAVRLLGCRSAPTNRPHCWKLGQHALEGARISTLHPLIGRGSDAANISGAARQGRWGAMVARRMHP